MEEVEEEVDWMEEGEDVAFVFVFFFFWDSTVVDVVVVEEEVVVVEEIVVVVFWPRFLLLPCGICRNLEMCVCVGGGGEGGGQD